LAWSQYPVSPYTGFLVLSRNYRHCYFYKHHNSAEITKFSFILFQAWKWPPYLKCRKCHKPVSWPQWQAVMWLWMARQWRMPRRPAWVALSAEAQYLHRPWITQIIPALTPGFHQLIMNTLSTQISNKFAKNWPKKLVN
jgi:hypothetical protein